MEALRNISTYSTSQILEPSAIKHCQRVNSTTNHLHSLGKKYSSLGNFLEFCLASLELLYRALTSILYWPISVMLSGLLRFYHQILSYHRDKHYDAYPARYKSFSVKLPSTTSEKNKEFIEIIEQVSPSSNTHFWNTSTQADYLFFLNRLDYFLHSFDKELKRLNIPKQYSHTYVFGLPYVLDIDRKEFLRDCLKNHIEHPCSSRKHPEISGACFGYIPSFFAWIDSLSFKMKLNTDEEKDSRIDTYLSESTHWTLKNADIHFKKKEKKQLQKMTK